MFARVSSHGMAFSGQDSVLKWTPLEISHIWLYGQSIGFKIRNIIISLIHVCGCYIPVKILINSTFNVLFKLVLQITYQSSVLIISYH